ncbi:Uncharacterised protein [Mycobacteroides abscessus subsp. abscessus]|nr:Uncharacterised protein [Mycobacteroides abscessus subsp. abscessus]SIG45218.1 Uncharacterised protein [Mycobacteroides abscessus subsp. abscessus]SIN27930.1 Uncharacterised protein [Mycobacteroides abscessus subsp. bolletii]SKT97437.1 Uncharacterised protein [Mycobacteroides abscessus subsp. abscessus]SKZ91214.1 Uncharacterised protein [Mycobacteroides abscessus subsp. abscessus]
MAVGNHCDATGLACKLLDRVTQVVNRPHDSFGVGHRIGEVYAVAHPEAPDGGAPLFADFEHVEMREDGGGHHDLRCGLRAAVGFGAERHAQRHAVGLADAVQRRIGHLSESLREVLGNAAFLIRQRVDGRAVPHGGDLLLAGSQHRIHQELEALLVERVGHIALVAVEVTVVPRGGTLASGRHVRQVGDIDSGLRQHRRIIMPRGKHFQGLDGVVRTALGMVVVTHSAGLDAAALKHRIRFEVDLSGLGHHAQVFGGLDGAQWSEPQPVQSCADDVAVTEDQCGRAVVLLLVEAEIFEHGRHPRG